MRIRRTTHKDDVGSDKPREPDEPEVVQLDEDQLGQLSAVFAAPRWLRDLGLASWLLAGVLLVLLGLIWLVGATSTITQPLIVAFVVACVTLPLVRRLARHRVGSGRSRGDRAPPAPGHRDPRGRARHRRDHLPGRRHLRERLERRRRDPGLARGRRRRLVRSRERKQHGEGGRPPGHLDARPRPRHRRQQPDLPRARALLLPPEPLLPPQGRSLAEVLGRGPLRYSEARCQDDHRRRDHLVPALLRRRDHRRRLQRDPRRASPRSCSESRWQARSRS